MPESAHNLKIRRACDACRKKRTKCDATSDSIPCSTCASKQIACTYNEHAKKTGIPKGYVTDLEERMRNLEILAAKVVPDGNLVKQIGPSFTLDTWLQRHNARSVEYAGTAGLNMPMSFRQGTPAIYSAPEAIVRLKSVAPTPNDNGEVSAPDLTEDNLFDQDQIKHIANHAQGRYYGSASSAYLIKAGRDMKQEVLGYDIPFNAQTDPPSLRPKFWNADPWDINPGVQADWSVVLRFPPKDLGRALVDLFFTNFIPHYPLFDRSSYLEDFAKETYKTNVRDAAIYLMICAIASKWTADPRVCVSPEMSGGKLDFLSSGWKYFIQICSLPPPSPLQTSTLQELQVAVLASFFAISSSTPRFSWHISGIGLRMAVDVGAHRRGNCAGNKTRSVKEEQYWKRVFWALTVLDKSGSTIQGSPTALHDDEFDADFPVEVDDEHWIQGSPDLPKQPQGKPSMISAFVLRLKLSQILGHMLGTIYSINRSKVHFGFTGEKWLQLKLSELDSSMNKWNNSIPDHLKWNPSNPNALFFVQSAMLHISYHNLQIEIHRPYIPWIHHCRRTPESTAISEPSRLICVNAAKQISHVLQVLMEKNVYIMPEFMKAACMAGIMLAMLSLHKVQAARQSGKDAKVDLTDERGMLRNCVRYLEISSERWYMAGYASELIKDLAPDILNVHDPTPPAATPIIDRTTFTTTHRVPGNPLLAEGHTTLCSSPSPWTMPSNTPTATSTPQSSLDFERAPVVPEGSPLSIDPPDYLSTSDPLFNSIYRSTLPATPQNVNPHSWEQSLDEEVVTIHSSSSMNVPGLGTEKVPSHSSDIPLYSGPTDKGKGRETQEYLEPIISSDDSSQLLAEEPGYMDIFNYLTQAGLGGGGNGTNMEGGIGYMKHMFQNLVPFDGVNINGREIGTNTAGVASDDEPELPWPVDVKEDSNSFDQILRQCGWINDDWSRNEVMNAGDGEPRI